MNEMRTKFWWTLRRGGNKWHRIKVEQPMPYTVLAHHLLKYNNKYFNNKQFSMVNIENGKRWTTHSKKGGQLPIEVLQFLLHHGKRLEYINIFQKLPKYTIINAVLYYYKPNSTLTLTADLVLNERDTNNYQSLVDPYIDNYLCCG